MMRFKSIDIIIVITLLAIFLIAVIGCSHKQKYDAKLSNIAGIVSDKPEEALDRLDSIDSDKLSDHNRHYYDFLSIKARDKAFIPHESDSLILDVFNYYKSDSINPIYNEVLYYCGRVYTDIGDYPTALKYYQWTLDNIEQLTDTSDLKKRVNSQTVVLLTKLRLYKQAVPYNSARLIQAVADRDTSSIADAQRAFGSIYYNLGSMADSEYVRSRYLNLADSMLTEVLHSPVNLPIDFMAETQVLLAGVKQAKGDLSSALSLARHTPDLVSSYSRNTALAFAADIYREAGIMDTAFMYAHELVVSENPSNKKTGYRIILSPEFRNMLHPDTLNRYYSEYKDILEAYFDDNRNELALMQEGQYNYTIHERERQRAEKHNEILKWTVVGVVILALVLAIVLLYVKYRDKTIIIRMRDDLDTLEALKQKLINSDMSKQTENIVQDTESNNIESFGLSEANSQSVLRNRLYEELMELYNRSDKESVPDEILTSDIYSRITADLEDKKSIDDQTFDELKETILSVSPQFVNNLKILTKGKLTKDELHLSLLIKCGFRPSDLIILFGLSNGAIISRKKTLGAKVLDRKESIKVITGIIRLL